MATKKKMLQAAAGNAGGAAAGGLNVEDVFSTYLYEGNGSTQTITNGIDLSGEGGLVWVKQRNGTRSHYLASPDFFYEPSPQYGSLKSDSTADLFYSKNTFGDSLWGDNGFNVGTTLSTSGETYASWTFRKAPKFFDVVTYTGNGVAGRTVSHNLGSVPGMIVVKQTSTSGQEWFVYHRSLGYTKYIYLSDTTAAGTYTGVWNAEPTSSVFSVGDDAGTNASGTEYVAYLFAHNDGDGEFGPDGDADIIKCGSFTTDGSGNFSADLGFEPQWIIVKNASGSDNWLMLDTMRGWTTEFKGQRLRADLSNAEATGAFIMSPTSTGFFGSGGGLATNSDYIYIAIRRGTKVPESADEVFDVSELNGSTPISTGFPVDAYLLGITNGGGTFTRQRLTGGTKFLETHSTAAENSGSDVGFDNNTGLNYTPLSTYVNWQWKRAPNFFDVVAYSGNNTQGRNVPHNLGVAPEMIWVKARDFTRGWNVYHKDLTASGGQEPFMELNATDAVNHDSSRYPSAPTATNFVLGNNEEVNSGNYDYIAYLFASLDGVSKVGSYTADGTNGRIIDCGFTTGARFVMIKGSNVTSKWRVWDSERGIVVGDDPWLALNETSAEVTNTDYIEPHSSGFKVNVDLNNGSAEWIFYAIA